MHVVRLALVRVVHRLAHARVWRKEVCPEPAHKKLVNQLGSVVIAPLCKDKNVTCRARTTLTFGDGVGAAVGLRFTSVLTENGLCDGVPHRFPRHLPLGRVHVRSERNQHELTVIPSVRFTGGAVWVSVRVK
jgi:hypothetical protein